METKNLVQADARVITITSVKVGDVYKRLEPKTNYSSTKLRFGVVTDVLNNGTDAVINAIEFVADWNSVNPELKVFGTDEEVALFPAQPDEFATHVDQLVNAAKAGVRDSTEKLSKAKEMLERVEALGGLQLTLAKTTEIH